MVDKESLRQRYLNRVKYICLALILLSGLGVSAYEKYRAEEAFKAFGFAFAAINDYYLDPIRSCVAPAAGVIRRAPALWNAEEQNERLRRRLTEAEARNQLLRERLARMERLTGLGQWSAPAPIGFLQADVVSFHDRDESAVLTINRGRRDGVRPRDPVVALGGLVGVVREVAEASSRVQALSDPVSAVGVFDRVSRARGVVMGQGMGSDLIFVPEDEALPILSGAELITSGFENSLYPKGLLVGRIDGRGETLYGEVHGLVEPSVDAGRVEEVLVLVRSDIAMSEDDWASTATLGEFSVRMPRGELGVEDMISTAPLSAQSTGDMVTTAVLTLPPSLLPASGREARR